MRTSNTRLPVLRCSVMSAFFWISTVGNAHSGTEACDGYQFEAVYTGEMLFNVAGGIEAGSRYLDNLDLTLQVDTVRAWGFGTGKLFVYGLYNNGTQFSDELIGDLQGTSNIDAPGAFRLFEFWYEHDADTWSVLAGLYDLNSEFDVNETGALFLNSSHGIGPDFSQSGRNGPSIFPVSSLAIRVASRWDWFSGRLAVLDGIPGHTDDPSSNRMHLSGDDGALIVGEMELATDLDGRVWAGFWHYTADFERPFGAGASNANSGWYLGGELGFEFDSFALAAFIRYGTANEELNILREYVGAGLVVDGIFRSRPEDQLGLAMSSGRVGAPYRHYLFDAGVASMSQETIWELTYRATINEHFAVQPNIQLVDNPSASTSLNDAWVLGLRFEIAI